MKEITVKAYDDLDFNRDNVRNEAAVTLIIGLNGSWRELDLTEHNEKLVRDILDELMAAGREPGEEVKVPSVKHKKTGPPDPAKIAFNEELREWCRENKIMNSSGTGYAYQTNNSLQDYIGQPLLRRYQAYLAGQAGAGNREEGE
jgi:hypothetical protein